MIYRISPNLTLKTKEDKNMRSNVKISNERINKRGDSWGMTTQVTIVSLVITINEEFKTHVCRMMF
jgi:hypothetical protein